MKQLLGYQERMPLGKGEQMFVTEEWATRLDKFIDAQPGSYLTNLAGVVGCTRSTITKLRNGAISVSRWIEPICTATGLAPPTQEVGSKDIAIIDLLGRITESERDGIIHLLEKMAEKSDK